MENGLAWILSRHSVRMFRQESVPDSLIDSILRAAMQAPSAGNEQPWEFIVVRDKTTLAAIPKFQPYSQMLPLAPVAILVCADLSREEYPGFWVQDCSAAMQNILLAAHSVGLGAVWLGIHPQKEREEGHRRTFGLPSHIVPFAIAALGYPAHEVAQPLSRYDVSRIHHEKW